ncbi:NucA/NucB deoxyribonuclease domain-containing protein [Streptomyces botrytidirepellens]|uniref:NucA/NucB deoxyribonuclease domain-containing protein n=1 Tax=Streptomyces botrytidirepellens TaxID=2486417 RepID=UPI003CCC7E12
MTARPGATEASPPRVRTPEVKTQANIRSSSGVGGVGVPRDLLKALTRTTNKARIQRNRASVCGRAVVGPSPPGMECDEYPFASMEGPPCPRDREGGRGCLKRSSAAKADCSPASTPRTVYWTVTTFYVQV